MDVQRARGPGGRLRVDPLRARQAGDRSVVRGRDQQAPAPALERAARACSGHSIRGRGAHSSKREGPSTGADSSAASRSMAEAAGAEARRKPKRCAESTPRRCRNLLMQAGVCASRPLALPDAPGGAESPRVELREARRAHELPRAAGAGPAHSCQRIERALNIHRDDPRAATDVSPSGLLRQLRYTVEPTSARAALLADGVGLSRTTWRGSRRDERPLCFELPRLARVLATAVPPLLLQALVETV